MNDTTLGSGVEIDVMPQLTMVIVNVSPIDFLIVRELQNIFIPP